MELAQGTAQFMAHEVQPGAYEHTPEIVRPPETQTLSIDKSMAQVFRDAKNAVRNREVSRKSQCSSITCSTILSLATGFYSGLSCFMCQCTCTKTMIPLSSISIQWTYFQRRELQFRARVFMLSRTMILLVMS